jgi:hypothetical protein
VLARRNAPRPAPRPTSTEPPTEPLFYETSAIGPKRGRGGDPPTTFERSRKKFPWTMESEHLDVTHDLRARDMTKLLQTVRGIITLL